MASVETARGPMDTADLGRVLMHEHVFVISTEIQQNYPEEWGDEDERVADAIRRLAELKEAGIDSICDPTAIGLGRYIPRDRPHRRTDRPQHHRRHRSLHVQRAPHLLPRAWAPGRRRSTP